MEHIAKYTRIILFISVYIYFFMIAWISSVIAEARHQTPGPGSRQTVKQGKEKKNNVKKNDTLSYASVKYSQC